MKIATWNVNSLKVRLDEVVGWLGREAPDVLALQETKVRDEDFPVDELAAHGYSAVYRGQSGYNGVALLARHTLADPDDLALMADGAVDQQRRVIGATIGGVRIVCVYVPNGQSVGTDKYRYKLEWLLALRHALAAELTRHPRLVVLGDFNIAPEDRDVYDPEAWRGQVLCSPPERAALAALLALGLCDVFRLFPQPERSYSWWDYRAGAFRRNRGLRIDLVLASEALRERCLSSRIDREPRGSPRPSDHAPVVAEIAVERT